MKGGTVDAFALFKKRVTNESGKTHSVNQLMQWGLIC